MFVGNTGDTEIGQRPLPGHAVNNHVWHDSVQRVMIIMAMRGCSYIRLCEGKFLGEPDAPCPWGIILPRIYEHGKAVWSGDPKSHMPVVFEFDFPRPHWIARSILQRNDSIIVGLSDVRSMGYPCKAKCHRDKSKTWDSQQACEYHSLFSFVFCALCETRLELFMEPRGTIIQR